MAFIPQEEINYIKQSANIVDIIGSYVSLSPKGKNFFGICPFHEDHSPSMSVSKEKQIYSCFTCGNTGNVFTFVERFLNISFAEAVASVAKQCGISLSVDISKKSEKSNRQEYEIMELATKLYQNNLYTTKGKEAIDYLSKRGLLEETIKDFEIGLSLEQNMLAPILKTKKYEEKMLKDLGLINDNNNDIFKNRIMFPIHDINGSPVGFTARCYLTDITPKYLNSKETIIFKKGNILFNYHNAKEHTRLNKSIVIVEGNMDAIRLASVGIKNVVALMGTSLTKEQLEHLKKLRVPLILMLDNDQAGETATVNIGEFLTENNIDFKVVRLNGAKDPDEYAIKYGKEKLEETIKNAISFMEFKLNFLKKDKNLDNVNDLSDYIKSVINSLKNSNDEILKEVTLQKLVRDYNISYSVLKNMLGNSKKEVVVKENTTLKRTGYDKICESILFSMMNDFEYIKLYQSLIGVFSKKEYRLIANEIIYYYEKNKKINVSDFISYIETNELKDKTLDIISKEIEMEISREIVLELINQYKIKENNNKIEEIKKEIKNELDVNKKEELLKKLTELKKGSVENENY